MWTKVSFSRYLKLLFKTSNIGMKNNYKSRLKLTLVTCKYLRLILQPLQTVNKCELSVWRGCKINRKHLQVTKWFYSFSNQSHFIIYIYIYIHMYIMIIIIYIIIYIHMYIYNIYIYNIDQYISIYPYLSLSLSLYIYI